MKTKKKTITHKIISILEGCLLLFMMMFVSVAVHEFGHLICGLLLGADTSEIHLSFFMGLTDLHFPEPIRAGSLRSIVLVSSGYLLNRIVIFFCQRLLKANILNKYQTEGAVFIFANHSFILIGWIGGWFKSTDFKIASLFIADNINQSTQTVMILLGLITALDLFFFKQLYSTLWKNFLSKVGFQVNPI